ncbi:MAG: hypothetical protein AB1714_04000 [Acidobacteriota bacterium]
MEDELIVDYLLRSLPADEEIELEKRYMTDDALFERISVVEDELIDQYVKDELTADKKVLFEKNFLTTPARMERVRFARSLIDWAAAQAERPAREPASESRLSSILRAFVALLRLQTPVVQLSFATGMVLLCVWLAFEYHRAEVRYQSMVAEKERAEQNERMLERRIAGLLRGGGSGEVRSPSGENAPAPGPVAGGPAAAPPQFVSVDLVPLVRGAGAQKLVVHRETQFVQARVEVEPALETSSYRTTVSTPEGTSVWSQEVRLAATPAEPVLSVMIPAAALKTGDYILTVSAPAADGTFEGIADYSFSIQLQ